MACGGDRVRLIAAEPASRAVEALGHRRFVLDAQAEVDRQLAVDLPVVLEVRAEVFVLMAKLPLRVMLPPGMPSRTETSSPPTGGAVELFSGPLPQCC